MVLLYTRCPLLRRFWPVERRHETGLRPADGCECIYEIGFEQSTVRITRNFGAAIADQDARCTNIPEKYLR